MSNIFIPRIRRIRTNDPTYLRRVTSLYAFSYLVQQFPKDLQTDCIQEVVSELKEKVPNIRIVALKVLKTLLPLVEESQRQFIKSSAQGLAADPDVDVRNCAQAILA